MSKDVNLLEDNVNKCFFTYLVPTVLSMVAYSFYVVADVMFVGIFVGSKALAAMTICLPYFTICSSIGLMLGIGAATTIAISNGRGHYEETSKTFTLAMIANVSIGLVITLIFGIFTKEICYLMGADETLIEYCLDYLKPVAVVSFAFILSTTMQIVVRADGNPRIVMTASIIANLLNIFLDYLFVVPMNMGIMGASIATAISPIVALIIMSFHFLSRHNKVHFVKDFWDKSLLKKVFVNGTGAFFLEFSSSIVMYLFNVVLIGIGGTIAVAAYSIISNIVFVGRAVFNGMAQAVQPLLSVSYGAGQLKRLKQAGNIAIFTSIGFSVLFYIFVFIFPSEVAAFFVGNDPQVISVAVPAIRLYFTSFLFTGINTMIMYYCQSTESAMYSTIISVLKGIILIFVGMAVLTPTFGINGVWLTITFAEVISLIVAIPLKALADKKTANDILKREYTYQ